MSLDTIFYIDQNICQNEEIKTYQCGMILWDPLSFARNIDALICPMCEVKGELRPTPWEERGKKKHNMPRKLHGIHGTVFLVSRVYIFTRSHQVLAHDAGIISQVQLLTRIPFILFHKTGVIRELHHFIVSHLQTSLTCSDVRVL